MAKKRKRARPDIMTKLPPEPSGAGGLAKVALGILLLLVVSIVISYLV